MELQVEQEVFRGDRVEMVREVMTERMHNLVHMLRTSVSFVIRTL